MFIANVPNALRKSVNSLDLVGKWLDDGIEVSFEAVQDGAKVLNKNGQELGQLIKEGSDEFFEISDDFIVASGSPQSFGSITIKSNTGETFINARYVKNSDGSIGFIEDVSSYGNQTVQNTIKQRGGLRATILGIKNTEDAHHIIPVQLLKENDVVKAAMNANPPFAFNSSHNGLAVEKYVKATGQGRHGPHPNYTNQINEVFTKLGNQGVQLSPMQAKQLLENLVDGNSKYQGIRNIINTTSSKINALDLKLSNINVFDLLGS